MRRLASFLQNNGGVKLGVGKKTMFSPYHRFSCESRLGKGSVFGCHLGVVGRA